MTATVPGDYNFTEADDEPIIIAVIDIEIHFV